MLNPRLKSAAERILPRFLTGWLDPVQRLIETEVQAAAAMARDGQVILDAGAGESRHRKYFNQGRYVALDTGSGDANWDYSKLDIIGDLEHLPLKPASIDLVLCMVVLEHTRNPRGVLEEFARVMKPRSRLVAIVPFLWEEHQAPHDYFRFTRYGVRHLFESLPFRLDTLEPIGGFFWLAARRCVGLLSFFQGGWRWILFCILAPFFGLLLPVLLYFLDGLDPDKTYSLGYHVRATRGDE